MIHNDGFVYESDVAIIVHACPGIENLTFEIDGGHTDIGTDESYITGIQTLPLRRIHCNLLQLTFRNSQISQFTHLTHLDLFHWYDFINIGMLTPLGDLPQLTHLSVPSNSDTPILAHLLDMCKSLRALVVFEAPPTLPTLEMEILAENDVRFVTVWPHDGIADWQRGALTGIDYWARADKHIARRLSGEVDRESHRLCWRRIPIFCSYSFPGRTCVLLGK
jgi:hypothetical protein